MSFTLFKLSFKYDRVWKNKRNEIVVRKKALAIMILGLLAGIFCGISCAFWLVVLWIPGIEFPKYYFFIFFIPLALLGLCMPLFIGLGKAVEAGAPSVTGTLNKLRRKKSEAHNQKNNSNEKWVRRPGNEILLIKNRMKKSSFSPTMPISVFILSFIALYGILAGQPTSLRYTILCSLFTFCLTYIIQLIRGRSLAGSPSVKICEKCLKTESIGLKKCACGGLYEPIDFYIYEENTDTV
jgi:hypothetical protein